MWEMVNENGENERFPGENIRVIEPMVCFRTNKATIWFNLNSVFNYENRGLNLIRLCELS